MRENDLGSPGLENPTYEDAGLVEVRSIVPSPFPGMDPYLEANPRWEGFHDWFVRKLAEQTMPRARELGCWIDVERTIYQQTPSGEVMMIGEPDEAVGVDSMPENRTSLTSAVNLAEPRACTKLCSIPILLSR